MTPLVIAALLGLATVAAGATVGGLVIVLAARLLPLAAAARIGARTRASLIAQARLAPLSLTLVALPLVQLAFWRFEPAAHQETVGWVLPGLAAAGAALVLLVAVRAVRALAATRAVARAWRAAGVCRVLPGWHGRAWTIDTAFPVVAVVGVRRPEFFVSGRVLGACSAAELTAIAAHEHAHVAARDNFTRVLFVFAPAAGAAAAALERAWAATAEEAADLAARAAGGGVTLARGPTAPARPGRGRPAPGGPRAPRRSR